jgi:4'-phosphopantetheinyl transferase EntD
MIAQLLPTAVEAADTFGDLPTATLFPEERAAVARSVDRRQREFTTVRACARTALARLGVRPVAIVPGADGAPSWPAGIVGSMTHCRGYRAAAVARGDHVLTIGLDAEPDEPLPDGVLEMVASVGERIHLASLAAERPNVCWDRLLFSTKEAVYKAWFPLTRQWLDFEHAVVTFDRDGGTFRARLRGVPQLAPAVGITEFAGHWMVQDGFVLTAVTVQQN